MIFDSLGIKPYLIIILPCVYITYIILSAILIIWFSCFKCGFWEEVT